MLHDPALAKDSSVLRYAQCWEDADILLEALDIQPGDTCLSIASAGDNTLAMLSRRPARLFAIDLSPPQLASLEIRVAAYRELDHGQVLELLGVVPSGRRLRLYQRCRPWLSGTTRNFWDSHVDDIVVGITGAGRLERYLRLFRNRILPLTHRKGCIARLLQGLQPEDRQTFYNCEWDTWRWRILFRIFFSRPVMGLLGRDPSYFRHAEGPVAEILLQRTRHAFMVQNPAENPYLQWILTGCYTSALPYALRPEHFDSIRENLDRLEWRCCSLEEFLTTFPNGVIDRHNLSDVFEYVSEDCYHRLLGHLIRVSRQGARMAYWNLLVERRRPPSLAHRLRPLTNLASRLYRQDKTFFYGNFIVEEVL